MTFLEPIINPWGLFLAAVCKPIGVSMGSLRQQYGAHLVPRFKGSAHTAKGRGI